MTAPVLPNQQHHRPGASGPGAYGGVRRRSLVRRAGRNGRTSPCAALCGGREGERRSSAKLAGCVHLWYTTKRGAMLLRSVKLPDVGHAAGVAKHADANRRIARPH